MKTRTLAAGLAALTMVALAACGDDNNASSSATNAPAATTAAATSDTTAATAAPADTTPVPIVGGTGEGGSLRLWLNGGDTPDDFVKFAIGEFNKKHPDVKVTFERQQWTGIVEKLTTALSSSDSPDVIELGNTQAQAFEAAAALKDLTADKAALGGDDLLQSLVEAGTYDGKFFAAPYYAGARVMIYRKDLFEKSGIAIPTTIDEMLAAGEKLKADNASVPNFSGMYLPGKNWFASLPFIWVNGGDIAVQDGTTWKGMLASDKSVTGLTEFQKFIEQTSGAPKDGDDSKDYIAFCNGEVGMMPAPGWKPGQIINPDDGCPDMEANIGAFAQPGLTAGTTSPAFLGGSNLAISAKSKSPELANELLQILVSPDYQKQFAAQGTIPALKSLLPTISGSDAATAQAKAAENSRFTPSSENWAAVEASNILPDMIVAISGGADVKTEAAKADAAIEGLLNG
ncbi:MAG TPA: extracellular solute-binding protein [Ilumatobacteraceae bacterium]|jgi:N,N'-diacetylchitobiose transport system substrate-binding protein|nr:extracellular solute-binding protein [Ilumatobacteraceae bacterium]